VCCTHKTVDCGSGGGGGLPFRYCMTYDWMFENVVSNLWYVVLCVGVGEEEYKKKCTSLVGLLCSDLLCH